MSLWQTYRNISPRTRIIFGIGVMVWAGVGTFVSDTAEKSLGWEPTEKDKEELKKYIPTITVVDKD